MRALRFRSAILAAACAHAVAVVAVHHAHGRSAVPSITRDADELIVVAVEPEPAPATATLPEPIAAPAPAREQSTAGRGAMRGRASAEVNPPSESVPVDVVFAAPSPSASASNDGWSLPAPTPSGLPGLSTDGYWKTVAMGPSAGTAGEHESPSAALQRGLREELDAHDQGVGLGASGPLVAAAHDAASGTSAPDVGSAVLEIECDASGRVVFARADSAGPDSAAWGSVARELVKLMASKTVRVPPGARGVRTRLRIAAERTLPSGERLETVAGAAPDEGCVKNGTMKKCLTGLPAGVGGTLGDLSNIGARRSRIVHVTVLDELAIR